ncbi:MAG: hypothetical protein U0Y96_05310 [Candidatus Kapaibacterium sp.]
MSILIEIVDTLKSGGLTDEQIVREFHDDETVVKNYVKGLLERKPQEDDTVSEIVETEQTSDKEKHYGIKTLVKNKLSRLLFDLPATKGEFEAPRNAQHRAITNIAKGQILISYSAANAGIEYLEQGVKIAEEYQMYNLCLYASRPLEQFYVNRQITDKSTLLKDKIEFYEQQLNIEKSVWALYEEFFVIANTTINYTADILKKVETVVKEMTKISQPVCSFTTYTLVLKAQLYYQQMKKDFSQALLVLNTMEQFYTAHKKLTTAILWSSMLIQKSYCLIELRHYHEATEYSERALQLVRENTVQRSMHLKQDLLLALRKQDITHAERVVKELEQYIARNRVPALWREQYNLMLAYYVFLVKSKTPAEKTKSFKIPLDVNEFVGASPIINRDKQGMNIAKVIVQVLLMLAEGNIDGANSKAESLRQYRQIYLKDGNYPRSSALLKLLHLLIEKEYDIQEVERKGAKYLADLVPNEKNQFGAMEGIEPIAYDDVWNIVTTIISVLVSKKILQKRVK